LFYRLSKSDDTVEVRIMRVLGGKGDRIRLEVSYSGPGFTVEQQGRVFNESASFYHGMIGSGVGFWLW
jgi:hypothetical protein